MYELDKYQQCAIKIINGIVLLKAGAGSGKTTVIVQRFHHLLSYVNSHEILCLTFSNYAAAELQKRINCHSSTYIGTFHGIGFRLLNEFGKVPKNIKIIDDHQLKYVLAKLNLTPYYAKLYDRSYTDIHTYNIYKNYCIENNIMDFTMILNEIEDLLQNDENFRKQLSKKFKYIMVDEYQDTNKQQENIIKLIQNNNLFCVGDEDQAIYQWRGANITNITEFSQSFPGSLVMYLPYNYRCPSSIVDVARQVIITNPNRDPYKHIIANRKIDNRFRLYYCKQISEEECIIQIIRQIPFNHNLAVLCRTSKILHNIGTYLQSKNVKYVSHGRDKSQLHFINAYINFIHFNNIDYLEQYSSFPKRKIGPKTQDKIILYYESYQSTDSSSHNYKAIEHAIQKTSAKEYENYIYIKEHMNNLTPKNTFRFLYEYLKLDDHLNYTRIFNALKYDASIKDVIGMVNNMKQIHLITIHAAKGLEFDHVVIPGCSDGSIPCHLAIHENTLEEELRLMYVAITRAKEYGYALYNAKNRAPLSRFLRPVTSYITRIV